MFVFRVVLYGVLIISSTVVLPVWCHYSETSIMLISAAIGEQNDNKGTELTFFGAFPNSGKLFYRSHLVRPALDYAVKRVNATFTSEDNFAMQYISTNEYEDCEAVDDFLVYKAIEEVTALRVASMARGDNIIEPVGFFGPGCSRGVAQMAKWLNVTNHTLFDPQATAKELGRKELYPTLTRTGYTDERLIEFYEGIFRKFNWTRSSVSVFYDNSDRVWQSIALPVAMLTGVKRVPFFSCADNTTTRITRWEAALQGIEYKSTVVLLFGDMKCVQDLLVQAVRMNLTRLAEGQLTFIVNHFFDAPYWGSLKIDNATMTDDYIEDLHQAYRRTLVVSYFNDKGRHARMLNLNQLLIEFVKYHKADYISSYDSILHALENEGINPAVMGYYVGVFLYAEAVKSLLNASGCSDDHDARIRLYKDGRRISQEIRRLRTFDIPYVGKVEVNENGDLVGEFVLRSYDPENHTFLAWLAFRSKDTAVREVRNFPFVAAAVPLNVPKPIRTTVPPNLEPEETVHISVIVVALAGVVVTVVVVAGLVIRYYVHKSDGCAKWWDINSSEIEYVQSSLICDRGSQDCLTLYADRSTIVTTYASSAGNEELAHFRNRIVEVRNIKKRVFVCKDELMDFRDMRLHHHPNLVKFFGIVTDTFETMVVTEYMARGSLNDFIAQEADWSLQRSDWGFRYSLLYDLIEALWFIHKTFRYHGHLTSFCCMIDKDFVLKVRDYAPKFLQRQLFEMNQWEQLWTAPEVLRQTVMSPEEYQKADIHSFGIILQQLAMECMPFPRADRTDFICETSTIVSRVRKREDPPFRPTVPPECCENSRYFTMMELCWSENPAGRPTLGSMKRILRSLRGHDSKGSLVDDLYRRLKSHADKLEQQVELRTNELRDEQSKIQALLHELLPDTVAESLLAKRRVDPQPYDCVTIYFSDIVSFTTISAESTPAEVVSMLNKLYELFDEVIGIYDAYKVETIGDAYMVASGLPKTNGDEHAAICSKLALHIRQVTKDFRVPHRRHQKLQLRIGIHSGPCMAGIVGTKMPRYCLFGDTVNTASRMESTSLPNQIHLSKATHELIKTREEFVVESRGIIDVKGKGPMETFWLCSGPEPEPMFIARRNTFMPSNTLCSPPGTSKMSRKQPVGKRQSVASLLQLNLQNEIPLQFLAAS